MWLDEGIARLTVPAGAAAGQHGARAGDRPHGDLYLDSSGVHLLFDLGEHLQPRQQQPRIVVPEGGPIRRALRIVDEAVEQIRAAV